MKAVVRGRTPSFSDCGLENPFPLHLETCPAGLKEEHPIFARCRCRTATWFLSKGESVEVLQQQEQAALVKPEKRSPVWVETSLLSVFRNSGWSSANLEQESDLVVLNSFLASTSKPFNRCWPRRRTRLTGGCLVFVREDYRAGIVDPKRFLFTARKGDTSQAALIDPTLSPSQGMKPTWDHLKMLPLEGAPWQKLLVCFPLPDDQKTPDPGWKELPKSFLGERFG